MTEGVFRPTMLLLTLAALILSVILALPTWQGIWPLWLDDGTYSHGLLLVPVVVWLLLTEGRRQPWPALVPQPLWLLPLAVATLLLSLAQLTAFELLQRALLLPIWLLLAAALLGTAWLWRLLLPALLLSLALPIWGPLLGLLQQLAILVVGQIMSLTPIPVTLSGTHISIPAGTFEIAEGCGGLRYVLVAAAIGLLWGHLYLRDYRVRLGYLAIALLIALISNWVRIILLILIGHGSDMQHSLMADHNTFGWYVFAVALLPMFWIGRQLPHRPATAPAPTTQPSRQSGAVVAVMFSAAALLAPTLLLTPTADSRTLVLPLPPENWQPLAAAPITQPIDVDQQWRARYRSADGHIVTLQIVWQALPRAGVELLDASALIDPDWQSGAVDYCADCLQQPRSNGEHLLRYRYISGGRIWQSRLSAKLAQLIGMLQGHTGSGLLWIEGECNSGCEGFANDFHHASTVLIEDLAAQVTR